MEIEDLNADERLALVGLVKAVVLADGRVSDEEVDEVKDIVDDIGEETYRDLLTAFEARFGDEASFRRFLQTIVRQDARDLIYGTILEGAAADAIEGGESELLTWLAGAWSIEITVDDE